MATIDDGAWTAIKHTNAIFDEDPNDGAPTRSGLNVVGQLVRRRGSDPAEQPATVSARYCHALTIQFLEEI